MLQNKIKKLTFCAVCIALATILSMFKLSSLPFGGSTTAFSMLVISLPGFLFGLPFGILSAFVYGLIQFITEPYFLNPIQVLNDYFFAFSALGLSGIFYKKNSMLSLSYIIAVLGRYIFAVISGYFFFAEYAWEGWTTLPYSLAYNASYIVPELLITLLVLQIPIVKKTILDIKKKLLN